MGCAVAQGAQGIEIVDGSAANRGLEILRLVQNHNGMRGLKVFDGLDARLTQGVDNVGIFGETVYVDDQNLNRAGTGKVAEGSQILAVIHYKVEGWVAIQALEMLVREAKVGHDALTNGDARHDDDEFFETVDTIQFVHGAEIGVGFARAGLHLDREIIGNRIRFSRLGGLRICAPFQIS